MGSEWKAQLLCQTPKAADGSASVCTARTVLQYGARAGARATAPTRCRDGALHIPGESGWRFAAVRRATRGFLLSTVHALHGSVGVVLSVCLSPLGDDRPLASCTRQPRPVKRLRSGDAVNKSVNRWQPSSPKPRELHMHPPPKAREHLARVEHVMFARIRP